MLQFGMGVTLAVFQLWLPAAALFFSMVFTFTLLTMVIPKRLEVWSDGVKVPFSYLNMFFYHSHCQQVVFYPGYKWGIPIKTIRSIEENPNACCASGRGIKFTTSVSRVVVIHRKGLVVKLSPENPSEFCSQVRYALSPDSYIQPI